MARAGARRRGALSGAGRVAAPPIPDRRRRGATGNWRIGFAVTRAAGGPARRAAAGVNNLWESCS